MNNKFGHYPEIIRIGAIILSFYFYNFSVRADNLSISNVKLIDNFIIESNDKPSGFRLVQFDISWNQSWKNKLNWDAAWVFIKFRVEHNEWKHCTLNYVDGVAINDGHKEPTGATISTPSDGKGIFIYQREGTKDQKQVVFEKVLLRWNSGQDGVIGNVNIKVRVFGIEMVYVPEGSFIAGGGGTGFKGFTPTTISTSDATVLPKGEDGISGSPKGGYPLGQIAPDSSNWPNGFNAFYCMKYELNQGQYTDFLNILSVSQQQNRYMNRRSARYTIRKSANEYEASVPNRACNFVSWGDGIAFSDWSALRPFTEMEFEKACRGPARPIPDEFAWGTTNIYKSVYDLANEDTPEELIRYSREIPKGNAAYNETNGYRGPFRSGIFAVNSTDLEREKTGASYYGIMELSGNLWERTISIGHPVGRKFKGDHGDGELSPAGDANVISWPNVDAIGVGFRGGGWRSGPTVLRVSDRVGAEDPRDGRSSAMGFRAVRSGSNK